MSVHLILGPMFAGKTTELIRLGQRHELAGRRVLHVRHNMDCRGENSTNNSLYTHNGLVPVANIRRASALIELMGELTSQSVDVICIDEGQFFSDLALGVNLFLANFYAKHVIIAALNATYRQKMFPQIILILPMAERVQYLTAVCFICGNAEAQFTRRLGERPSQLNGNEIRVKYFFDDYNIYFVSRLPKKL
jgi:thymidine kinase